ncbi:Arm DNA-binding domain-containing protein [Gluconobacter oxydans]|uniref:Arm DNA-binding domain-containing protein n=1 Tax=Gluconobacter oxydans TaxID=442 RepID=UPI0039E79F18
MGVSVLTDVAVRKAAPKESPYKLSDAQGLYLLVKPNGTKLWCLKYRFGGKEKALSIGAYHKVSLQRHARGRVPVKSYAMGRTLPSPGSRNALPRPGQTISSI